MLTRAAAADTPQRLARGRERIVLVAQDYIQKGIDEGARLVAGGLGRPKGLNRGFYVKPTVFADVVPGMTIEREEIFGPVLSMLPFDSEDEAVAIANDTAYGLTNYVQSADGARRNRLARLLRSGMVEMNGQSRASGGPLRRRQSLGPRARGRDLGDRGVHRGQGDLRLGRRPGRRR